MDFVSLFALPLKRDTRNDPYHTHFRDFVARVNSIPHADILEVGSRGSEMRKTFPNAGSYTGFDIHAGDGVDVIGDLHNLSRYFPDRQFDAAFCISTFEHLAMPWKAAWELSKVLKPGGLLFIATHPTWPPHMEPWDFFRFSADSFSVLLGGVGFEIVKADMGLPCRIMSLSKEPPAKRAHIHPTYMGVAVIARKVAEPRDDLRWDIDVPATLKTVYPID